MDEETRKAIDELTSTGKRRSRPTYGPVPPLHKREAFDYRAHATAMGIHKAAERESLERAAAYRRREEELEHERARLAALAAKASEFAKGERPNRVFKGIDLKLEVAILSVDTSAACIVLNAPMTEAMIKTIEDTIMVTQRCWVSDKHIWRFSPMALPMLKPLLKAHYKDVQTLGVPKAIPSTKFDQLMHRIDKDDKDKIYKLLAMKHHPDRGGSKETMTLINLVFKGG